MQREKEKKLPRLNDEEKGKGGGISENRKTRAGNKAQHFPQTRGVICPILSSRNDDDRPGAGGAIITSLGSHPSASPQLRSITITIIVARWCRRCALRPYRR